MDTINEEDDESWPDKVRKRITQERQTEQTEEADVTPAEPSRVATPDVQRGHNPTPVIASTPRTTTPARPGVVPQTPRAATPSLAVTPSLQRSTQREVTPSLQQSARQGVTSTTTGLREDNLPAPPVTNTDDGVASAPLETDGMQRPTRARRAPTWLKDFATEFQALDQSLLNCQSVQTHGIAAAASNSMAQAQVRVAILENPDILSRETWHPSDDDEKERPLSGSQLDTINVSSRTKQRITASFHRTAAANGLCKIDGCEFKSTNRRKLLEHTESHYLIYAVSCGFLTSKRDSAVKHIRTVHQKEGSITQWDVDHWSEFSKTDSSLPTEYPVCPVKARTFSSRCSKLSTKEAADGASARTVPMATVRVSRVKVADNIRNTQAQRGDDQPKPDSKPDEILHTRCTTGVEKTPIVTVQKPVSLQRQLSQRKQDLKDLKRMIKTTREDILRLEGQLANIDIRQDTHINDLA